VHIKSLHIIIIIIIIQELAPQIGTINARLWR